MAVKLAYSRDTLMVARMDEMKVVRMADMMVLKMAVLMDLNWESRLVAKRVMNWDER